MNHQELKEFLKERLKIKIDFDINFSQSKTLEVYLVLDDECISSDFIRLEDLHCEMGIFRR